MMLAITSNRDVNSSKHLILRDGNTSGLFFPKAQTSVMLPSVGISPKIYSPELSHVCL